MKAESLRILNKTFMPSSADDQQRVLELNALP